MKLLSIILLAALFHQGSIETNEHAAFRLGARSGLYYLETTGQFPSDKWINEAYLAAQKSDKDWDLFLKGAKK